MVKNVIGLSSVLHRLEAFSSCTKKYQEINLYQAKDCYLEHVLKQKAGNELHYKTDMASLHMNRQISVKPDTIK